MEHKASETPLLGVAENLRFGTQSYDLVRKHFDSEQNPVCFRGTVPKYQMKKAVRNLLLIIVDVMANILFVITANKFPQYREMQ